MSKSKKNSAHHANNQNQTKKNNEVVNKISKEAVNSDVSEEGSIENAAEEAGVFTDESFTDKMKSIVLPWIEHDVKSGRLIAPDQTGLQYYYAIHPDTKGSIVFFHGFSEFFGKLHEVFYNFYKAGYSVYFMEQRGFGLSDRQVPQLSHVYVHDFGEYVDDMKLFFGQVVIKTEPDTPKFIYAHSMGGAVAGLYLEKYKGDYTAAVLSSPMCGLRLNVPRWKLTLLRLLVAIKKNDKELAPGQEEFSHELANFEHASCSSPVRYDYQMQQRLANEHYQSHPSTYGWILAAVKAMDKLLAHARSINTPILLCQAGQDSLVPPEPQNRFANDVHNISIAKFGSSKHEIYNSTYNTLKVYYQIILSYYDDQCKHNKIVPFVNEVH